MWLYAIPDIGVINRIDTSDWIGLMQTIRGYLGTLNPDLAVAFDNIPIYYYGSEQNQIGTHVSWQRFVGCHETTLENLMMNSTFDRNYCCLDTKSGIIS
jgi:hypothetical protein